MSYLDTNKLRHLVANGHNLAKETVLDLLTRVEHQQDKELRQLALDKYPATAPPLDPDTLKLGAQYAWKPDDAYAFDNPIFSIIEQLTSDLKHHAQANHLVLDPASIRIEFNDDGTGTYTSRLVAYGKPKEQS